MSRDHTSSNGFHGGNNHNPEPAMPFLCVICDSVLNDEQAYILHHQHHVDRGEVQLSSNVQQPDIAVHCLSCNSVVQSAEAYYMHYTQQHLEIYGFPDTFLTMPIRCAICNAVSTGVQAYTDHYQGHFVPGEMQNGVALNQNGVDGDDTDEEIYNSSTESTSSDDDDDENDGDDSDDSSDDDLVAIDPVGN